MPKTYHWGGGESWTPMDSFWWSLTSPGGNTAKPTQTLDFSQKPPKPQTSWNLSSKHIETSKPFFSWATFWFSWGLPTAFHQPRTFGKLIGGVVSPGPPWILFGAASPVLGETQQNPPKPLISPKNHHHTCIAVIQPSPSSRRGRLVHVLGCFSLEVHVSCDVPIPFGILAWIYPSVLLGIQVEK